LAAKADCERWGQWQKTKKEWRENNLDKSRKSNLASYYRQRENSPEKVLLRYRREVLRRTHPEVPFTITVEDIVIPELCPILGIPLKMGRGKFSPNSPTIDRIHPHRGYVSGNVHVISHRANTLKNNATVVELEKVLAFLRSRDEQCGGGKADEDG
jgi:hypothetical protein